jgi:transcriptional regulator with XRE-family HTH domain
MKLRAARIDKGWTVATLSAKSGLHKSAIGHFEGGSRRPSFENLRQLCFALEVSADYLLSLKGVV